MAAENSRIEALRKREAEIKAKIAAHEAKEKAKAEKQRTRVKTLIGEAVFAEADKAPELRGLVVAALERKITTPQDREFLKSQGWWSK